MPQVEFVQPTSFFIERASQKAPMSKMHQHSLYEFYYVIRGEREYFIENRFFKLCEGDMVLIPNGLLHRTAGKGATRYLVYFEAERLSEYFKEGAISSLLPSEPIVFRASEEEKERVPMLLKSLLMEYSRGSLARDEVIAGIIYQLLFIMAYSQSTYINDEQTDDRIAKIVKYINESYNEITDIEQIAKKFFISKYHLCRIFSKALGISIVSYLNIIKIKVACEKIRAGRESLTEIALECGFNSSSYFCKVFKAQKGMTPYEYKKKHT